MRGKKITYAWIRQQAQRDHNQQAIKALAELQPFDPKNLQHLKVLHKWVWYYGGAIRNWDLYHVYVGYLGQAPEYTLRDVQKWLQGFAGLKKRSSPR